MVKTKPKALSKEARTVVLLTIGGFLFFVVSLLGFILWHPRILEMAFNWLVLTGTGAILLTGFLMGELIKIKEELPRWAFYLLLVMTPFGAIGITLFMNLFFIDLFGFQ